MDSDAIIEVNRLSKAYGLLPVLRGVDFSIDRGEWVLLFGANGSGKSTLLRLLSGLSKPSAGRIRIGGWELPREAMAVRAQCGLVAHRPLLYENLTAAENLDFFGKLYGLAADERAQRGRDLLRQAGLAKSAERIVRTFSRGMKQRLSIARATLHQPEILLLDEPYSGLDQAACQNLDEMLAVAQEAGRTILLSTHQLSRAPAAAGRALVLSGGRIAYDGASDPGNLAELYVEAAGATSL
ncbi:MAG: heme ABC exporter ATP-binding protein CcmA [Chloroflexi bacterium]|nr:heme ABC exporter ATP-binding protein CcmA [Chloroflexota bacterium]